MRLRFDVFGKFTVEVERTASKWQVFRLADGKRLPSYDIVIPSEVCSAEIAQYLDDIYNELAGPDGRVTEL